MLLLRLCVAALAAACSIAALADEDADDAPTCTRIAPGTLGENLQNRLLITEDASVRRTTYSWQSDDQATVRVNLSHVLQASWDCATWEVSLLLPPGTHFDVDGETGSRTALNRTDTAEFVVGMDRRDGWHYEDMAYENALINAIVEIKVFDGNDVPVTVSGVTDSQGRYHRNVRVGFVSK